MKEKLELSIIVPIYNEASRVLVFFAMIKQQEGIDFELIFSDGNSTDSSVERIEKAAEKSSFPVKVLEGAKGRGGQMNRGVMVSKADMLLFLHIDSFFKDSLALSKGIAALQSEGNGSSAAARFLLKFSKESGRSAFGYYCYEIKARCGLPGTINGDQGFLMTRKFFNTVACFNDSLPFLEDKYMEEAVGRRGRWILVDAEIFTSARRFEREGLYERQVLNALVMNFFSVGETDFLAQLPTIYAAQSETARLNLTPFFYQIARHLQQKSWKDRGLFWYRTGRYVCSNSWQVALVIDAWKNYKKGLPYRQKTDVLSFFYRYCYPLVTIIPGNIIAAVITWFWFYLMLLRSAKPGNTRLTEY